MGMHGNFYNNKRALMKQKDFKDVRGRIEWIVPRVYGSIACELWDMGWDADQIEELFAKSQARWKDSERNGWDMLQNVEDVIGIPLRYFKDTGNIV